MPWHPSDAQKHNSAATSDGAQQHWAATANAVLKQTGDEGKAVRIANAALQKRNDRLGRKYRIVHPRG